MILFRKYLETYQSRGKDEGFTLIEVLIALFLFALISVGTMTALTQSLRGKSQLEMAVKTINELNSARAIIGTDMSTLTLRPIRDELGGIKPYSLTTDGEALLTFTRRGRENPGGLETRGDLERVEYLLAENNLIRRSFSHENPSSNPTYIDRVLLNNIQDVTVKAQNFSAGRVQTVEQFRLSSTQSTDVPDILIFEITDRNGVAINHAFEFES